MATLEELSWAPMGNTKLAKLLPESIVFEQRVVERRKSFWRFAVVVITGYGLSGPEGCAPALTLVSPYLS